MKNILVISVFFLAPCLINTPGFSATLPAEQYSNVRQDSPQDSSAQQFAEEIEKNREMVAIWKDHVRTLTNERDAAYKKLESLKNQNRVAVSQAPALPSKTFTAVESDGLNDKLVVSLRKELERAKVDKAMILKDSEESLRKIEELKAQNAAIRAEQDKLKTLASKTRAVESDKDFLLKEKEDAEREAQALESKVAILADENQRIKANLSEMQRDQSDKGTLANLYQSLRSDYAQQQERLKILTVEADQLREENQKFLNSHSTVQEALNQQESVFNEKIQSLTAENQKASAFQADFDRQKRDKEMAEEAYVTLKNKWNDLNERIKATVIEKDNALRQVEESRAKIQSIEDQSQKFALIQQNYSILENNFKQQVQRANVLQSKMVEMELANQSLNAQLRDYQGTNSREVQELKTKLQANLADMQNLKSNFESYLESLIQSFDDRSKATGISNTANTTS